MIGSAEEVGNEYIYQNMSDEEKRILKEQERAKIKAEKDMVQAQIEAEKLKGKALEEEKDRLEIESKRQAEEQKRLEEERKNKVAEITNVEFLDKDGKSKNTFETGESMDIKIDFIIKKDIFFIIGVGLHSITGGQIFGYNTEMDSYLINKNSKSVTLHLNSIPILKGEYFLNVACADSTGGVNYDFKPKCKTLRIYSRRLDNKYVGILNIEHKWKE
jgi:vacuolar-type H+-ATPase subunit I/STV1